MDFFLKGNNVKLTKIMTPRGNSAECKDVSANPLNLHLRTKVRNFMPSFQIDVITRDETRRDEKKGSKEVE